MVSIQDDFRESEPSSGSRPPGSRRGCLWIAIPAVALVMLVFCCGGVGMLMYGGMSVLYSSPPYQEALRRAQASPEVVEKLGEPIEAGWMINGKVNIQNDDGTADLKIPLTGPKGAGTVAVEGTMTDGAWSFDSVTFTSSDGEVIELAE